MYGGDDFVKGLITLGVILFLLGFGCSQACSAISSRYGVHIEVYKK